MAMMKKSQMNGMTAKIAGPDPEPMGKVVVTDADRMKAAKDMYLTGLFKDRAPELYAMNLLPKNIGGQMVFTMPGSATSTKESGEVGFIKNPNSNTFSMVVMSRSKDGSSSIQMTDERNLTSDDVLSRMSRFTGGFAKASESSSEEAKNLEAKNRRVNVIKKSTK